MSSGADGAAQCTTAEAADEECERALRAYRAARAKRDAEKWIKVTCLAEVSAAQGNRDRVRTAQSAAERECERLALSVRATEQESSAAKAAAEELTKVALSSAQELDFWAAERLERDLLLAAAEEKQAAASAAAQKAEQELQEQEGLAEELRGHRETLHAGLQPSMDLKKLVDRELAFKVREKRDADERRTLMRQLLPAADGWGGAAPSAGDSAEPCSARGSPLMGHSWSFEAPQAGLVDVPGDGECHGALDPTSPRGRPGTDGGLPQSP